MGTLKCPLFRIVPFSYNPTLSYYAVVCNNSLEYFESGSKSPFCCIRPFVPIVTASANKLPAEVFERDLESELVKHNPSIFTSWYVLISFYLRKNILPCNLGARVLIAGIQKMVITFNSLLFYVAMLSPSLRLLFVWNVSCIQRYFCSLLTWIQISL